jgi:MOSC domain-containing protein YiiM
MGVMAAHVISVNVGQPALTPWLGDPGRTSIQKHAVAGPVRVDPLGLTGDQVSDTKFHGGLDMAVYAFAREDLDAWASRLGAPIPDGQFGENLTTQGIDVNAALLGERWRIGTAVFELSHVRIPCDTFTRWMRKSGYDATRWVKRFAQEGRPGPYLRVIEPGYVAAGDTMSVLSRPDHDVSVTMAFRALTTERQLLPRLLEVGDALAAEPREEAETYLARTTAKQPAPTFD